MGEPGDLLDESGGPVLDEGGTPILGESGGLGEETGMPDSFEIGTGPGYSKPTHDQLQAAYELVEEMMEEEGPFDGVWGFSQGGALIASM